MIGCPTGRSCVRLLTVPPEHAAENLAFDEFLLNQREDVLRFWECARPVVVVGRGGRILEQVRSDACAADGVDVLRRCSGGGAVVLGPGCLNYSLVFSLEVRPEWRDVRRSFREILNRMAKALGAAVCDPSDLVWQGRKVSGNSQRRTAGAILHHGTLLYGFDPGLAARYLLEPARQPEYRRGRTHTEFLGNLPYPAEEIQRRVADAWGAGLYSENDR
jgi:lipoate-protein ligase A